MFSYIELLKLYKFIEFIRFHQFRVTIFVKSATDWFFEFG